MARTFGYVADEVARKAASGWSDEVAEEVQDAWKYLNEVDPATGNTRIAGKLFLDFDTVKDLGSWFRQAKAYAESEGLVIRKSGVRNAAETRLYFRMETKEDFDIRMARKAEEEAKLKALIEAGKAPAPKKRGRPRKTTSEAPNGK